MVIAAGIGVRTAQAQVGDLSMVLGRTVTDQRLASGVAVTRAGVTLAVNSAGDADVETRAGFPPHTRFRAASITKTFVAATVLQLVSEGRVNLDASVETNPHGPPRTPDQLLDLALTKPAQFPPGAMVKQGGPALSVTFTQAVEEPADDPMHRVVDALYCPHTT